MRLILVGTNAFSERWLKVFFASNNVNVAALVNHRADRFPHICRSHGYPARNCFTSLKKALSEREAEGVVVTVPTKYHYRHAREALEAGKHVLVEKPLTATLAEAGKLLNLARERKRLISMVSQHRYTPRLKEMKKYCGPKAPLGRPLTFFVRIHMNRPPSYYDHEARRTGRGVLTIQGSHAMDWIGWLFGEVDSCAAAIGTLYHKTQNEDNAYAMIKMKSGVMGLFDINHFARGKDVSEFEILFEKGVLRFSLKDGFRIERGEKSRKVELASMDPQFDALKAQLENFISACEGRKPLDVTGEDGLRVMRLIDALYRSTGRMVPVA
ncbi:MAG TPA: Gfo/Idh/MocA family oxidoreductase [Spirochaetia bacterium]|nr:Gfo/Idh/MocA family oxidoreductase [Spirochaetia bacterium]